jgi:predicted chitinase
MAHFLKPPTATSTGYDVDNRLAPGSVWRMQVLVGGSRKIALWGGAELRIRSNNDGVVPKSEIREFPVAGASEVRLIGIPGKTLGTSILEAGQGGDDKKNEPIKVVWIRLQVQVTEVTTDMLRAIMPRAAAALYVEPLNRAMAAGGIDTPERRAAFLAQISVESNQLQDTVENLNYTARRLQQVWPRRFPTAAAAAPFAHNPEALGNHVYADRLGNGNEASGDGYRFRGRGLMQVTGRANYRAVGFENNPEALSNPTTAANTAAAFWQRNGLNGQTTDVLGRAQFDAVSRTVNGGNVGMQDRWEAYRRACSALGLDP